MPAPPDESLVPVAVAPVVLVGLSVGVDAGWLPALLVLAAISVVLRRQSRGIAWAQEAGASGPGLAVGLAITAAGALGAILLATTLAHALGDLLTTYPAAFWALPVLGVALVAGRKLARPLAWGLAVAIFAAGWSGASFERAGIGARGEARSGPIAGIHPFQSTAVMIDGYGPFDLPINDYVEPDGSQGYGPLELAAALELAMHRIAEVHFSAGPARARKAFADAETEVGEVPQLYDEATNPFSTGVVVRSGTHGHGSRVQFVCPGAPVDPRPPRPRSVMRASCPSKYASEGSAGLGLTGRWPGYVEVLGGGRLSWARALGWTRSADGRGHELAGPERGLWAMLVLAFALFLAFRPRAGESVRTVAGAVAWMGLMAGFVLVVAFIRSPSVGAFESSGDSGGLLLAAAVAGLAGAAGLSAAGVAPARAVEASGRWAAAVVGALSLGTVWALSEPTVAVWSGDPSSPKDLVRHIADQSSLALGVDVQTAEAAVSAAFVAVLVAALGHVLGPLLRGVIAVGSGHRGARHRPIAVIGIVVALLVWFVDPARIVILVGLGLLAVTAAALNIVGRRARGGPVALDAGVHVAVCGLVLFAIGGELVSRPPDALAVGSALLGSAVVLASLLVLVGRARGPA